MCAGISFSIDQIEPYELDQFFTPEEFKKQRKGGLIETFFWHNKPFLPVEENGLVHLYHWGNQDGFLKMPKTGWAKIESVQDGRWDYLVPQAVRIPSLMGYEKKHWFKTPEGIKGVKVRYHNVIRVCLLTTKASQEFVAYTGHDRMPVGKIIYFNK